MTHSFRHIGSLFALTIDVISRIIDRYDLKFIRNSEIEPISKECKIILFI